MLKSKQIEQILSVIRDKKKVRNVGIIAHIDHGKTTLTDLLLAEAGLIPYSLAGEIRVLDYLKEEQKRGITIKAANISLLHEVNGEKYVVNLVDTPGHVDFTGKVTRALRIIDGAIVLVDAVEEIMAQTEVVTRQALNERVKPVLLINKVDRLIRELKLSTEEIQKKVSRIIQDFNNLIDVYGEPPFKDEWKISFSKGNVALGSALHKWGLTFETVRRKNVRFSDIIEAYHKGEWRKLRGLIPLHKAILEMVINVLPNPIEAQKYRIPKIWRGNLNSEIGRAMLECDPKGPTSICVASVKLDPKDGLVATGRIFSGEIKNDDQVYLLNAGIKCDIQQVSIYMGAFREPTGWLDSGNIVALPRLKSIRAGETIIDLAYKDAMVPFEEIKYVSEPVITVSLEPKDPRDLPRLINLLNNLSIEDPNLMVTVNEETGEYLLSGIGELHLELAIKSIGEYEPDLEVIVSKPMIAYRESVSKVGAVITVSSPNKRNQISVRVEPLGELMSKILEDTSKSAINLPENEGRVLAVEENQNILVDLTGKDYAEEDLDAIISGFKWACKSGPLCEEPLRGLKAKLIDVNLHEEPAQRGHAQIMPAMRKAILGSFLTADPVLLEPICRIQISIPAENLGDVTNLIARRRGKISSITPRGLIFVVDGFMPIAESFGLADELRSISSGRAFWQSRFSHWERIPENRMIQVISSVRRRKGLPAEIPDVKSFIS